MFGYRKKYAQLLEENEKLREKLIKAQDESIRLGDITFESQKSVRYYRAHDDNAQNALGEVREKNRELVRKIQAVCVDNDRLIALLESYGIDSNEEKSFGVCLRFTHHKPGEEIALESMGDWYLLLCPGNNGVPYWEDAVLDLTDGGEAVVFKSQDESGETYGSGDDFWYAAVPDEDTISIPCDAAPEAPDVGEVLPFQMPEDPDGLPDDEDEDDE